MIGIDLYWEVLRHFDRHWDQRHNFDRHWSVLIGIGHWSGESCDKICHQHIRYDDNSYREEEFDCFLSYGSHHGYRWYQSSKLFKIRVIFRPCRVIRKLTCNNQGLNFLLLKSFGWEKRTCTYFHIGSGHIRLVFGVINCRNKIKHKGSYQVC